MADISKLDADEQMLAELGYKQELNRSWSGFSNFAISFSIISILAGCFTTFYFGWNNGGPIAISLGWPLIAAFILIIGFCMSELVSAYPTSGGIYWWASKLGGVKAGYYTGWLNLVGLIAIVASVAYGAATFLDYCVLAFQHVVGRRATRLERVFCMFLRHPDLRLAGEHLLQPPARDLQQHLGVVARHRRHRRRRSSCGSSSRTAPRTGAPATCSPARSTTPAACTRRRQRRQTSGSGSTCCRSGFLLTQYTITGYDASAHLSEETNGAANSAAKGIWRSIFYSAIGGWILLLTFLFAVQDADAVTAGGGGVQIIFDQALTPKMAGLVLLIATIGQLFCTTACLTSASRMLFAFSRDGAVPGAKYWSKLNKAADAGLRGASPSPWRA